MQPRFTLRRCAQPFLPDHRHQDLASADGPIDDLTEVFARLDRIHIHKNPLRSEAITQPIKQPPRMPGAVLSSIADENLRRPVGRWV